jgi:hypothetical protein
MESVFCGRMSGAKGLMVLIAAVALMGVVQAADTFVADRCVFLHGLGVKGATDLLLMDVSDITVCLYSSTTVPRITPITHFIFFSRPMLVVFVILDRVKDINDSTKKLEQ